MLKNKLDEFACALLVQLMCALAALNRMAIDNPKSTGAGVAGFAAIAGAHFGLHLSAGWVAGIAGFVTLFVGTFAGDSHRPRGK